MYRIFRIAILLSALPALMLSADDKIELLGIAEISGDARDHSGQTDTLLNGSPHNRFGGISGLEYSGKGDLYLAIADRGPDDGAVPYHCRFHHVHIKLPITTKSAEMTLGNCVLLKDGFDRRFIGEASAFEPNEMHAERFDPEAIRVAPSGNVYVSDEYGPQLIEFNAAGVEQQRFKIPAHYKIESPGVGKSEENDTNKSGRSANRGMEGLAISADGKFLVGLMQSPLLQDSERNEQGVPKGVNCRLLKIELATGDVTEYLYRLDDPSNKLNEIVPFGDEHSPGEQYLVIERDGEAGEKSQFKKVMKIDLSEATELSAASPLPAFAHPKNVRAVKKSVFIDLLDPQYKLVGKAMPEKLEGLTFGQRLPDGRRTLFVASDNDFEAAQTTKVYLFGIGQ